MTVFVLALFCSVFFIHSGDRQWNWFCDQLPPKARTRVVNAGGAAWRTFTGYTHGIILVAGTNAVFVGLALFALGVPLALPLALLEFFAAFVPLIGSPIALAIAAVVALAAKGPIVAAVVLVLIVVIGQIEGHLLHPLVMSWAVRLHPVVVALSVIGGAIAAGVLGAVVAVPLVSVLWAVRQALRGAGGARPARGERERTRQDLPTPTPTPTPTPRRRTRPGRPGTPVLPRRSFSSAGSRMLPLHHQALRRLDMRRAVGIDGDVQPPARDVEPSTFSGR